MRVINALLTANKAVGLNFLANAVSDNFYNSFKFQEQI